MHSYLKYKMVVLNIETHCLKKKCCLKGVTKREPNWIVRKKNMVCELALRRQVIKEHFVLMGQH